MKPPTNFAALIAAAGLATAATGSFAQSFDVPLSPLSEPASSGTWAQSTTDSADADFD